MSEVYLGIENKTPVFWQAAFPLNSAHLSLTHLVSTQTKLNSSTNMLILVY